MSSFKPGPAGVALAAVALLGLSALSRVPYPVASPDDAVLRLSWRMQGETVEECVERSDEDLERLPPHMRSERECRTMGASYRLRVRVDGRGVGDEVVEPGGLRRDRPIYVFRDVPVQAGLRRVEVWFAPTDTGGSATPVFTGSLEFAPLRVLVLTRDRDGRVLPLVP